MRSGALQKVRAIFAALGGFALLESGQSGAHAESSQKSSRSRADVAAARAGEARFTAEPSAVHVITCDGPGENGDELYVYEDTLRSAFRVARRDWGGIGGFSTLEDAIRFGCTAERRATQASARARVR